MNLVDKMGDFDVKQVTFEGKGQGLVATRDFQVGEVVMREDPLIDMPLKVFDNPDMDRVERWLDRKVNGLTCQQRQIYFELSDCRSDLRADDSEKTALGIFWTNCMNFIDESAAVFPEMARTNHSCAPNTEFITNKGLTQQELIAVQPIKQGQEITLSYLAANGEGSDIAKKRQEYLREYYGFQCVCAACTLATHEEDRIQVRRHQSKGMEALNIFEMEELVDGLDRIGSKVYHREEMNRRFFDQALLHNDKVLTLKSFSSVYLYKAILSCPQLEEWKSNFLKSKCVLIGGKDYVFPPDN